MPKGIYDRKTAKQPPRRNMFLSKEELSKLYLTEKKGTIEIAQSLGCTAQAIMYWLAKYDIPMRSIAEANKIILARGGGGYKTKKFFLTKELLTKEFLVRRKTPNQIAAEFRCSWDVVRRNLLRNGFKLPQHTKGQGRRTTTISRKFQREALRKHGYKCQICGYDKFVNVCHIKPRYLNGSDAVENAIVLCPNHHAELDYGILKLSQ